MEKKGIGSHNNQEGGFPSLEVISSTDSAFQFASRLERRHLPRLCLTTEQFRLSRNGRLFSVTGLSERGMGLWLVEGGGSDLFVVGSLLEGYLNLLGQRFFLRARVKSLRKDCVGCEFEDLSQDSKDILARFLDPAVLGSKMKPIPSSEASSLWYHGPSDTDFVMRREADGHFKQFSLFVSDSFVQWDEEEGLSTGKTTASGERSELRGILRLETVLLARDVQPDVHKLSIAKKIVLSSNLPQDLKNKCIRQLSESK